MIVPRFLARPRFLGQLEALAQQTGAAFHEIGLTDDKDNMLAPDRQTHRAAAEPGHVDADGMLTSRGGTAALSHMYDRLVELTEARPRDDEGRGADGPRDATG